MFKPDHLHFVTMALEHIAFKVVQYQEKERHYTFNGKIVYITSILTLLTRTKSHDLNKLQGMLENVGKQKP